MKKILLSIKPQFVEQILAGTKCVEYRRRIPKEAKGKKVIIYCSSPIKMIVAEFTIGGILADTPDHLWELTSEIGGLTKEELLKYFHNKKIAYAYQIEDLRIFKKPQKLSVYGLNRAPQDFQYINNI